MFDPKLGLGVDGPPGRPHDLLKLLNRNFSDENWLSQVAAQSYVHQLGFEKYVLLELPMGGAVRLHFWPKDSKRLEEDVHSHCASFTSTVVCGSLTSELYELKPGGTHVAYMYRFDRLSGRSELSGGRHVALNASARSILDVGSNYELDSRTLHRVTRVAPGTVTFSIWGQRCAEAMVVKPVGSRPQDCTRHAGMSPAVVRNRLRQIFEMIK